MYKRVALNSIAALALLGAASVHAESQPGFYVGAGIGFGFANTRPKDENGVAAALMGGLTFDVDRDVAVDVGYRFRTIVTDADFFADDNPHDHAVTVGLRFKY